MGTARPGGTIETNNLGGACRRMNRDSDSKSC